MAREISSVCDFIFRSIRTCSPTDMVNIDSTVRTVRGIYMYRKDHTVESTIFTLWSKKVIPFPHLDEKYKHLRMTKDRTQHHGMMVTSSNFLPLPRHQETQGDVPLARLEPDGQAETTNLTQ